MKNYISNEPFRIGCRCRRLLWLQEQEKNEQIEFCPELSALAQNYVRGGETVLAEEISERADETIRLAKNGARVIKRPAFKIGDAVVAADLLVINKDRTIIYFSYPALNPRRVFCREAGLMMAAAEINGFENIKVMLLLPRKEFVRHGDIDPRAFFAVYDMSDEARKLRDKSYIFSRVLSETLESSSEPDVELHKNCFNPDNCKYFEYCTKDMPYPNVFKISRLNINTKLQMYSEGKIGYADLRNDSRLTDNQRKQIRMSMDNVPPVVKKKELSEFLSSLWYPLCFLDFESWQPPVPPSDNMHPFEQVAFQYSLHIVESEGAPVIHREFLAEGEADPREALARQLAADIPHGACILAYNKQFETMVVSGLANMFADIREPLEKIRDNIADLMLPFQKKLYYDRRMEGSFSIKAVLPALYPDDPELSYDNLAEIHNGSQAMLSYSKLREETPERAAEIRRCLLRYCELDTLGMVKIVEKLRDAVK